MAETDEIVEKSARNLANAKTLRAEYLNVRDLLGHKRLVLPLNALEAITAHLGK
jgi:large subunit ribosomal protein L4